MLRRCLSGRPAQPTMSTTKQQPDIARTSRLAHEATLECLRRIPELRERIGAWRRADETIGLVLTMGALHEGHLSLIGRSVRENDRTLVTAFVNPLQLFGEDYSGYPRREEADILLARDSGADVLFAPSVAELFPNVRRAPEDFLTLISVRKLTDRLCARACPGLYEGIATEVAKWLILTLPDRAYFGEKDYQQLQMIRRLCSDLGIPVEITAVPTLRMHDGLPYASRNLQLTEGERTIAPELYRVLSDAAGRLADPQRPTKGVVAHARERLEQLGFSKVDYLEVCDEELLQPLAHVDRPARVFGAVWLHRARLTDNVPIALGRAGVGLPVHYEAPGWRLRPPRH
jgi:pantoate--beta-alanine ligase